jgi:hypothetical protein
MDSPLRAFVAHESLSHSSLLRGEQLANTAVPPLGAVSNANVVKDNPRNAQLLTAIKC